MPSEPCRAAPRSAQRQVRNLLEEHPEATGERGCPRRRCRVPRSDASPQLLPEGFPTCLSPPAHAESAAEVSFASDQASAPTRAARLAGLLSRGRAGTTWTAPYEYTRTPSSIASAMGLDRLVRATAVLPRRSMMFTAPHPAGSTFFDQSRLYSHMSPGVHRAFDQCSAPVEDPPAELT